MLAMRYESRYKVVLTGMLSAGLLAALLWILSDVARWVFAVLKATGH